MSFREKSAWVMALLMLGTGGFYVREVLTASAALGHAPPPLAALMPYVFMTVVGSIVLQTGLALLSPREAEAPADERERQIQHRAGNWSGYVLAAGAIAGLWRFLVTGDGAEMFHVVFISLIASQLAEYGIAIFLFRRGV